MSHRDANIAGPNKELLVKVNNALAEAETALVKAETALATMIINGAGESGDRDKAAAAVAAASKAVDAARSQVDDVRGIKGGRRKHKAKGTKRRRYSGGFMGLEKMLPASVANFLGLSPPPPAAPVAPGAPPPGAPPPGARPFGGKSGKKRKHSRRKY